MGETIWLGLQGTVVLWVMSASLAVVVALMLAAASVGRNRAGRYVARGVIDLTRGVPTSLIVIAAGIATFGLPTTLELPTIYPGTPSTLQLLAWTIVGALALGSAGHLAEIFRCARAALARSILEQASILGLSSVRRACLVSREVASIALAPTGSRLVHHLHNTAFAALFPVTELFGALQSETSATFRVREYAVLGCVLYAGMSLVVWVLFRLLEVIFFHHPPPLASTGTSRGTSPVADVALGVRPNGSAVSPDVRSGMREQARP